MIFLLCIMGMYRKAEFFRMKYPLTLEEIQTRFKKLQSGKRKTNDKNSTIRKIELDCDVEHKRAKDENYIIGMDFEFQISARRGVPWQKTRDLYGLIFLPKYDILVVLGRDDAVSELLSFIGKTLYPDAGSHVVFRHLQFVPDSLVDTIRKLRKDDPQSWCDEYRGKHDAIKYQGKKTKSNFSLGEGECVLDDAEAIDAIDNSSSINPVFKFYKCSKLTPKRYDKPKYILFNGGNGSVSVSVGQDFDNWYKFITEFLVKELQYGKDL